MRFYYIVFVLLFAISSLSGVSINGQALDYKNNITDVIPKSSKMSDGKETTRILIVHFEDILSKDTKQNYLYNGIENISFADGNKADGYDYRMFGDDSAFVKSFFYKQNQYRFNFFCLAK